MARVEMYSSDLCPYCRMARRLLNAKGVAYTVLEVDGDPSAWREMSARSGGHTVPQILVDDQPLGGFDELAALDRAGRLDALLT